MVEIKKILLATDFSECSEEAAKYAIELCRYFKSELCVLHVVSTMHYRQYDFAELQIDPNADELLEIAKREMEDVLPPEIKEELHVEAVTLRGIPYAEICDVAKQKDVDMIVLGTHGRTGLQHLLLGSVAEKVVRIAPCPVLTVKHPDTPPAME